MTTTHPTATRTSPTSAAPGTDPATGLHSWLYEGVVTHRRHVDVDHRLAQRVLMALVDLDELDEAFAAHPLWSTRHPAPVRLRRQDLFGDPAIPPATAVRDALGAELGRPVEGPVRVLTHLRHWGWTFNPISLAFAYDAEGAAVSAVLAEVTNTPWHESHAYALDVPPPREAERFGVRFAKALHVSPFLDLDLDHVLRFSPPGQERLVVEMESRRRTPDDELALTARLVLRRRPLDRPTMTEVLRRHPLPSHRVSAGIHLNALRLWRAGAPFRRHPKHTSPSPSRSQR